MTSSAYHLVETAPPEAEPVGLTDMKLHLRLDHDNDDALLTGLIATARDLCESMTGLSLITRGYSLFMDAWPGTARTAWWDGMREGADMPLHNTTLLLPRPPAVGITAVRLIDDNGDAHVFPATDYIVDTLRRPARIVLKHGISPPAMMRPVNGLQVQYTAGFGATAQSVPAPLRQGIRQLATHLYTHRGDTADAALAASGARQLFQPFCTMRIA